MKQIFAGSVLVLLLLACGKDNFETKPQLKIKSADPKEVTNERPLTIIIEFTDKEGDVSDSLYIVRQRLNLNGAETFLPLPYKLPDFPKTTKGEFELNLDYNQDVTLNMNPIRIPGTNTNEQDTLRLKFVAKDKGGNFSDTAILDDIYVIRP
jgi:hypothetical protein